MRAFRTLFLSVALSVAVYAPGCGSDDTDAPALDPTIADVVFLEGATDEALLALLAIPPKEDPANAAVLTSPADGEEVPGALPVTFRWAVSVRDASHRLLDDAPNAPPPVRGPTLELIGPVRAAWAHGEPVDGTAYFVVFSTPSNPKLLRVFTKGTTYTPDAAAWSKLKGAGGPITAKITWAYFEDNRVVQDGGGPYAGPATTFTIAP